MTKVETAARTIVDADTAATHKAAQVRDAPLAKLAGSAAQVADQPPLIALSIGTAVVGLFAKRPDLVRGGLRMLAAHAVATGVKTAIKHRVNRTRPAKALDDGEHRFEPGTSRDHDLSSFPSGHLAGAVAVSRAAAHEIGGTGTPALLATTAVAAAQAPAGNHYLLDMAAGAVIGWVSEAIVGMVFDRAEPFVQRAWARV
ncbi:MAG TPA: phosphatase PAP2 family protein [Sphingomonas sp.]|jgi:membrane-associated phospholipid phosphatase